MSAMGKHESFRISDDWDLKSKLLRRRFPQLTTSDLSFEKQDESDLLERIANRLNKRHEEVIEIIKNTIPNKFISNLKINYHE
ncbi:MAG TPA: hypothetical protein PKN96_11525 [Flavobacterium sp.]|uniref:hypothetical protein n=1 Tax=Flavobacterium sp. TaxID=239 RepID=UPI002C04DDBB|nr:hypothetical protein [Flavobacterium sp.]HNP33911.1 hypothetical protein [Flavobacterium sp.]